MAVTTRAGKGSALTHVELDANFTILGLAHGDTSADLDVSQVIIDSTATGADPKLQSSGGHFQSNLFIRDSQTGTSVRTSAVFRTKYTDAGFTVGQGAGSWLELETQAGVKNLGSLYARLESVTDADNWTGKFVLAPARYVSGSMEYPELLTASRDKVEITSDVGAVYIQNLPTTDPLSAGQLWNDNGTLKISAG